MLAHRQLLDLIEAALLADPPVAGGNVQRQGTRPLAATKSQMVTLRLVRSRGQQVMLGGPAPIEWQTLVGVGCIARGVAPQTPDEAVSDLVAAVHARIAGTATLAAAGYRLHPEHHLEWEQDEIEERIGAVIAIYTVRHVAAVGNIETAA
jgi:hypothetical protein